MCHHQLPNEKVLSSGLWRSMIGFSVSSGSGNVKHYSCNAAIKLKKDLIIAHST